MARNVFTEEEKQAFINAICNHEPERTGDMHGRRIFVRCQLTAFHRRNWHRCNLGNGMVIRWPGHGLMMGEMDRVYVHDGREHPGHDA